MTNIYELLLLLLDYGCFATLKVEKFSIFDSKPAHDVWRTNGDFLSKSWMWDQNRNFNMNPRKIVCMRSLGCFIHLVCSIARMTGKKSNKAGHARRVINLEHWNTQLLLLKAMLDYGMLSLVFRTLSFDIWCVCVCVFMIGVIRGLSVILPLYFCFQHAVAATD